MSKIEELEEPKTYINLFCCHLSLNIIYTLSYVSAAVFLNIINRVIFYTYNFNKYNFTFMFLQQLFCIIFFLIISRKSQTFKEKAGEISFSDFLTLKYYYFSFGVVFILNALVTIIGTQMIINAAMFQTLRKLVLVKVYIFDLFFGYKKISTFTSICVILVTIGGLLCGIDTFSRDYLGITVTMIGNIITVAYNKLTESFRRNYLSGGSFFGYFLSMFFSCSLVIVLNCGFFMSNEKNSSLFTILLANAKDVVTSLLSYFFLAGNRFTLNIFLGLIISTTGAFMFSSKSICDNMLSKSDSYNKINKSDIERNEGNSKFQKVEIKGESNDVNNS